MIPTSVAMAVVCGMWLQAVCKDAWLSHKFLSFPIDKSGSVAILFPSTVEVDEFYVNCRLAGG